MVETMGLEPTTPCLQSRCSSQLSYVPLRAGSCGEPSCDATRRETGAVRRIQPSAGTSPERSTGSIQSARRPG